MGCSVLQAFKANAEAAIDNLDGTSRNGRQLHVRFACSTSSVKVSNLSPFVSNELLEEAFCMFGPVERAVVCTDERGRSLGYGIVDFYRKSHAQQAISRCRDDFFVLTRQVCVCVCLCLCLSVFVSICPLVYVSVQVHLQYICLFGMCFFVCL